MKKFVHKLIVLLLISGTTAFAQDKAKSHYIIHNPDPNIPISAYQEAIEKKDLDSFRFYDTRRTIKIADSQTTIEIFSAKELLDLYGKPISPFTIKDPSKATNIEFIFSPEYKAFKEKIIK